MKQNGSAVISIKGLNKTYSTGFEALKEINLEIHKGEIFALLGPNGAGKTTLINIVSGVVTPSQGHVTVDGFDIVKEYRKTRTKIGLVPQELTTEMFEAVKDVVTFSRGLFGKSKNPKLVESVLKSLSLWDKKDDEIRTLSGGMKRRVMIAKALVHEPEVLFLDEPTAGVDVSLRRGMWELVNELRKSGVTIILTTHYLEEAEAMADRIGVINHGKIIVVEEKETLMQKLGKKQLSLTLAHPLASIPLGLEKYQLSLGDEGHVLNYIYDATKKDVGVAQLIKDLAEKGITFQDLQTKESNLEEIFLTLVERK